MSNKRYTDYELKLKNKIEENKDGEYSVKFLMTKIIDESIFSNCCDETKEKMFDRYETELETSVKEGNTPPLKDSYKDKYEFQDEQGYFSDYFPLNVQDYIYKYNLEEEMYLIKEREQKKQQLFETKKDKHNEKIQKFEQKQQEKKRLSDLRKEEQRKSIKNAINELRDTNNKKNESHLSGGYSLSL